jgi:ABC-type taurine transport system substrate-binding protein
MATRAAQQKWRQTTRLVKSQLNVTVRQLVHKDLAEIAKAEKLRGKGEAVSFASFVAKGLMQSAQHSAEAKRLLRVFRDSYARDRDLYE